MVTSVELGGLGSFLLRIRDGGLRLSRFLLKLLWRLAIFGWIF